MNTRTCSKCNLDKDTTNFGTYTDPRNGKIKTRGICKQCRVLIEGERAKQSRPSRNISNKTWKESNKEAVRKYNKERARLKRQTDIQYKLCSAVSGRTRSILAAKDASRHVILFGCNSLLLKQWLTFQFDETMNWDNYSEFWQVDHVIPLTAFDMRYRSQQLLACHWTNVRPLEGNENRLKSNHLQLDVILEQIKKLQRFTQLYGYQTNIDTCWWQRYELWYGKNPKVDGSFEDFLKWIIRNENTEEDALVSLV